MITKNTIERVGRTLNPISIWVVAVGLTILPIEAISQQSPTLDEEPVGLFHIGLWVTDPNETLSFLQELSDFTVFAESERDTGGRRILVRDAKGQVVEILTADNVVAHPEFDLHPLGRTAGVAHIAVWVSDTIHVRDRLKSMGYRILRQIPSIEEDGYPVKGFFGEVRILFVEGPDRVTFELFEIKEQ